MHPTQQPEPNIKQSNRSILTASHFIGLCAQRKERQPDSCVPSLHDIMSQSELTTQLLGEVVQ